MKLKKYGAIGVMEWQLNLPVGKATVHVEFKGGFENKYGIHPATFMTTDPIVQTVIERSYYFASGKIKLLDVKDLGLSPMEIAAQKRKAEEIAAQKRKAEEAAKKKAEADAQAKAEADAQAGNAQGQAIESPGTVASNAASEGTADDAEAELENETEEVAENEEAEENAVDGSVYDVEEETTSGVDMASDESEYTVVQVTCNEDAKNYLVDNFNCSARKLTNWATILEVGKANGVLFEK
ncbi:hypothetical protein [Leyella stercorea]|uniref:hypothetical protein n=1 Tax=Leyella stercorea TaxID=363265 RepID=UPI00242AD1A1|nr:hypothetical protein [Leyella stercorea]